MDATNTPLWKWANQNAFGDHLPDEDPDGDNQSFTYNLRFAGQYFDSETKLHYNYFRDYEPATGRYLSADPIGLSGGLNTYGYVDGNPLLYIDPYGLYNLNDFIADANDFTHGSFSYIRGVYRTGRFSARHFGLLGECEQQKAREEGIIFAEVTDQLLNNSNFRDQVASAIKDYPDNNRAYVVGRGGTGLLISSGLTRAGGAYGSALGIILPVVSINGDIRSAIESGAHSSQAIAAAIAGGVTGNLPSFTGCGC